MGGSRRLKLICPSRFVQGEPPAMASSIAQMGSSMCFLASLTTLVQGLIFLAQKLQDLSVEFSACGFLEEDCNIAWRQFFTLRPDIFLDLWAPVLFGILGLSIHLASTDSRRFVKNYVYYAVFMLTTALFANIGYNGQLGVFLAGYSAVCAAACAVARLTGEKDIYLLDLKKG